MLRHVGGVFLVLSLLALSACEPEAQPLPVDILPPPTEIISVEQDTASVPLIYEITPQLSDYMPNYALIASRATVIEQGLPDAQNEDVPPAKIFVTLGTYAGAETSPTPLRVALVLSADRLPPAQIDLLQQALNPSRLVEHLSIPGTTPSSTNEPITGLSEVFANAGIPDGFQLNLAHLYAPSTQAVTDVLAQANVRLQWSEYTYDETLTGLQQHRLDGVLLAFHDEIKTEWINTLPDLIWIDLYTVPISYHITGEISGLAFDVFGYPLPPE